MYKAAGSDSTHSSEAVPRVRSLLCCIHTQPEVDSVAGAVIFFN